MRSLRLPLFFFLLSLLLGTASAWAAACSSSVSCGFNACQTPSDAVAPDLWTRLEPVDALGLPTGTSSTIESRDTTWNDRNGAYSLSKPYWQSMDIEDGWLFAGVNLGFQTWSLSNPRSPNRAGNVSSSAIPSLFSDPHEYFLIKDVDAPAGNSNVVTMTGGGSMGMVIWDTSNKNSPRIVYQDGGQSNEKYGEEVYATTINGTVYGFLAAARFDGAGLWMYDVSRALGLGSGVCIEQRPTITNSNCNGVFKAKLSNAPMSHVDGAGNDTDGHFVVFSGGLAGGTGFEIWNVSDPDQPQSVMTGLSSDKVHGGALWLHEDKLYLALAVRFRDEGLIYDVSCLLTGACTLPSSPLYSFPLANYSALTIATVTASESNGKPFVFFGRRSGYSLSGLQSEWLFDASGLPAADPVEITGGDPNNGNLGQPTMTVSGTTVGYWSWYYSCHPTGSNFFEPTDGMFNGEYFYRAGSSLFDVHELQDVVVSPSIFDSGFETGNLTEWTSSAQ
ncbi:MAG: hypothetical protein AAF604_13405 [Acidobacteriota bacterium]